MTQDTPAALPSELALIEKAVQHVGIKSLLNHGAGSLVYSEGVQGVTQEDLVAYTREIALHCVVALGPQAATSAAGGATGVLTDEVQCHLEAAANTLEWIAKRQRQVCDTLEPVSDIRQASKLAAEGYRRIGLAMTAIDAALAAQIPDSGAGPAMAKEARKLSSILHGMVEGAATADDEDIYASDYPLPDGDTFIYRAASLLNRMAAALAQQGAQNG